MEIQHISYVKRKNTYNTLICGDIEMKENSEFLQGVTITTNHPIVTVDKSGGLIYSANAIRERYIADTIYELIKKLPGVIEQNNHLSLIGSNGLKIIINGRLSSMTFDQLTSFLQSLPADRVTHLKVMYNPPPKYQTRGAVINVELSRAIEFQGEVHSEYTNKHTNTFKSGTNILLPLEKIGIDFSYEYASLAKLTEVDFTGKHNLHGIYYSIIQQQAIRGRENNNQIRIGFDASLSEKSSLNTTYNASLSPKNSTRTNSHGNFILAENRKNGDNYLHNIAMQYNHDNGWCADIDYTSYKLGQTQFISHNRQGKTELYEVSSTQDVDMLQLSLDKEFNVCESITLNAGSSYSISGSKDISSYIKRQGNSNFEDTKFKLKEQYYSIYTGLEKRFSQKLTATAYITTEYYKRDDIEKWLLYPQGSLTYITSATHIFQGTFSSEKIYPPFWDMQNTINYIDGYSEIHGNPDLLPMQRYHQTLLYMYKQKYITQLFYTYNDNYFKQSAFQDPDNLRLIYETKNWDNFLDSSRNIIQKMLGNTQLRL